MIDFEPETCPETNPKPARKPSTRHASTSNGVDKAIRRPRKPDQRESDQVLGLCRHRQASPRRQNRSRLSVNLLRTQRRSSLAARPMRNRANLAPAFVAQIIKKYEGTRLGRQEIEAEILDDVPRALWTRELLEELRWPAGKSVPDLSRVVVAIDPAVTSGEEADETGLVVVGRDYAGHGFVLDDRSGRYAPMEWAREASTANTMRTGSWPRSTTAATLSRRRCGWSTTMSRSTPCARRGESLSGPNR